MNGLILIWMVFLLLSLILVNFFKVVFDLVVFVYDWVLLIMLRWLNWLWWLCLFELIELVLVMLYWCRIFWVGLSVVEEKLVDVDLCFEGIWLFYVCGVWDWCWCMLFVGYLFVFGVGGRGIWVCMVDCDWRVCLWKCGWFLGDVFGFVGLVVLFGLLFSLFKVVVRLVKLMFLFFWIFFLFSDYWNMSVFIFKLVLVFFSVEVIFLGELLLNIFFKFFFILFIEFFCL